MRNGERVIVSAAVTGDGEHHHGWVADAYEFLGVTFVEVCFDRPAADGRTGCVVSAMEMITKEVAATEWTQRPGQTSDPSAEASGTKQR